MEMDQNLWNTAEMPYLGGWTSIYKSFWCELQGTRSLNHSQNNVIYNR